MILHSIVSPSDIFFNNGMRQTLSCVRVDGGLLELENGRIKRLISTDPKLYLDKRYQPDTAYNTARFPAGR